MLSTGNSLHKEYALKQLDNKVLVANMPRKRLENTAVTLFRKAKNDLEEWVEQIPHLSRWACSNGRRTRETRIPIKRPSF